MFLRGMPFVLKSALPPLVVLVLAACGNPDGPPGEPGENNLALNKAATASTEDQRYSFFGPVYQAGYATDGDYSTFWQSEERNNQWLRVDLGEEKTVTRVVLVWQNPYAREYKVQVSANGSDWTDVHEEKAGNGGRDEININASGRYFRMLGVRLANREGEFALTEFEMYGPSGPPNKLPVFVVSDLVSADGNEGQPYTGSIAGSATDADGDTIVYSKVSGPDWLVVTADGSLRGTPGKGDDGLNEWTVRATDNKGGQAGAQLAINIVKKPNTPPAFVNDAIDGGSVPSTLSYTGSLAGSAKDDDGDALTWEKVDGPDWLQVLPGGAMQGQPGVADEGTNSFTIRVLDGQGGSAEAVLTVVVTEKPNTPPVFTESVIQRGNAVVASAYGESLGQVAKDDDNDALTYSRVSGPAWLTIGPDGSLTGTPGAGDTGGNSWTIAVGDGRGGQATATLRITVDAKPNIPPVFPSTSLDGGTVQERDAYTGSVAGAAKDDDGDALVYEKASGPAWLNVTPNGSLSGMPGAGDVGVSQWTIRVRDGRGGDATAQLSITVTPAPNIPPVFTESSIDGGDLAAGADYSGTLAARTKDDDGDALTYTRISGPAWLRVSPDGALSGRPQAADRGLNEWTVQVDDGEAQATATYTILVLNNLPVIAGGKVDGGSIRAGAALTGSVAGAARDDDGDGLNWSLVSGPAWLSLAADGTLSGTPGSGDRGTGQWTMRVSDGQDSVTAVLTVEVLNNPPGVTAAVIDGGSVVAESAYSSSVGSYGRDADGDGLSWSLISGPAWLKVSADGGLSGTPAEADEGQAEWTVRVSDGQDSATATLKIMVEPKPNTPPVFVTAEIDGGGLNAKSAYGDSLAGAATDADDDPLTFTKRSGPAWLMVGSDGTLSGTPGSGDRGENRWTVQVNDGEDQATATLVIVVRNNVPVFARAELDGGSLSTGGSYNGRISDASDKDGDPLTYEKLSGPAWLKVDSTGGLTGSPAAADRGENRWTVQVSDGTDQATATLLVTVRNIAPVFTTPVIDAGALAAGSSLSGSISGSASDAEGDYLSYSKVSGPGWLTVGSNGALSGLPRAGDRGTGRWTVRVSDGSDSATAELTIVVRNNDPVFPSSVIDGGGAVAESAYSGDLAGAADDADADTLNFSISNGPGWLAVSTDGRLTGTPAEGDEGKNQWSVLVSDGYGGTASATLEIIVAPKPNIPPVFLTGTIDGGTILSGTDYSGSLGDVAKDDDGDRLSFSKVSGPAWLQVGKDGELSGTPAEADAGENRFTVRVSDGEDSADGTLIVQVQSASAAPDAPASVTASDVGTRAVWDKDRRRWSTNQFNLDDRIRVSWSGVSGAVSYNIYRDDDGYAVPLVEGITGTSWDDLGVINIGAVAGFYKSENPVYIYRITAVGDNGNESELSPESNPGQADLTPEEFLQLTSFMEDFSIRRFTLPTEFVDFQRDLDGYVGGSATMVVDFSLLFGAPTRVDLAVDLNGYDDWGIVIDGGLAGEVSTLGGSGTLPGEYTYQGTHNGYKTFVITVTAVDVNTGDITSEIEGTLYYNGKTLNYGPQPWDFPF